MNAIPSAAAASPIYDVVICGGGLAGLTLARQLRMRLPELSIALVERTARPLPLAAHKVGESSVEAGAHYFGKVLQLENYFRAAHLPKFGLRFFLGNPAGPFEQRRELGQAIFPPTPAYQIDRGRLENDLRQMAADMGVTLWEGCAVEDIVLGAGDEPHAIHIRPQDGPDAVLRARWVVDAQGRRRLLQRKLHLQENSGHSASAAWWRVDGRVDVCDFVPRSNREWHTRVVESRYFSTNHMMGWGYWVWLIPLSSGITSVGIVTDETMHPFRSYGTDFAQALSWLEKHEPVVYRAVKDRPPLDFLGLRQFSYHSRQVFSSDRWSCVGEAGVFSDPFYSPGSDFIAISNTITTTLIARYFRGTLTPAMVDLYNHCYLDLLAQSTYRIYSGTYATFGHAQVFAIKMFWDAAYYWSFWAQMFFQGIFEDPDALAEFCPMAERFNVVAARMQRLFIDWAAKMPPRNLPGFIDMAMCGPLLPMLHLDLNTKRNRQECLTAVRENLERVEELAQAIFFEAARACCPEEARDLPAWINAWGISLDPAAWERDGLTRPTTTPRDLTLMTEQIRVICEPPRGWAKVKLDLKGALVRAFSGKLFYGLSRWYIRSCLRDRSGLRLRRVVFRSLFTSARSGNGVPNGRPAEPALTVSEKCRSPAEEATL